MNHSFGSGGWFDASAFVNPDGSLAHPADGTFSPRGSRNEWYNPGFQSWNLTAEKVFHVVPHHESQLLTFRAEAFNVLNQTNYAFPQSSYSPTSSSFGVVAAASTFPARILQFAGKIIF